MRVNSAAPDTTAAKAATRAAPRSPGGRGSPNTVMPAAIGRAFVQSVARPAVVSALPPLEAELQRDEREPVAREERGNECDVEAARYGGLRSDVPRCVEHACGDPQARAPSDDVRGGPGRKRGGTYRRHHPESGTAEGDGTGGLVASGE